MSRRGRCRCGSLLMFNPSPQGYKTKCPGCGAVVRLREADPAAPIPLLPPEGVPADHAAMEMVETTPYYGPLAQDDPPPYQEPKRSSAGWWWLGALLLIALAVGAAAWANWIGGSHGASGG